MFIANPPSEFKKRKSNNNEILAISGALSGTTNCCYKLGINKLTGDLYYRDINNTWQLVPTGGGGSGSGMGYETVSTYANISASTADRWIRVAADETNNGNKSLYLYTSGIGLEFIQTIA